MIKLYVGNLPFSYSEQELEGLFSEYGAVKSVKLITDRATGRARGFGFVEMESKQDAQKAIEELSRKKIGERVLVVNEARPQEKREPSRERSSFGGPRRPRF